MPAVTDSEGSPPRLLVVVAHPDDETFGCGSLLLHAAARGMVTAVCCATRGEAGQPAPGFDETHGPLGRIREGELHAAAAVLGVSIVELLDFADSGMSGPAGPQTLVGADPNTVRDEVQRVIERVSPHIVVTLDASDGHRDHERIRDATLAAVGSSDRPVGRTYLQCLRRSLLERWLAHTRSQNPSSQHLEMIVHGTPDELITTVIDSRSLLADRERAIAEHRSQTSPFEGLPPDLYHAFLTEEHLRRVVPPWDGGPRERDIA